MAAKKKSKKRGSHKAIVAQLHGETQMKVSGLIGVVTNLQAELSQLMRDLMIKQFSRAAKRGHNVSVDLGWVKHTIDEIIKEGGAKG